MTLQGANRGVEKGLKVVGGIVSLGGAYWLASLIADAARQGNDQAAAVLASASIMLAIAGFLLLCRGVRAA